MTFGRPELLWLAVALPVAVAAAAVGYVRRRRRVARALGDPVLVSRLGIDDLGRVPVLRLVLLTLAAALLGVAAADPRWGLKSVETHVSSFNAVLALDVSKSMLARDVPPNRLERQRLLARLLLRELPGDRFGVVIFAGRAYVLSPLTVDHAALELFVDALDPEMVSQGGSSLASALSQAVGLAAADKPVRGDRVVVVMTDGEALEDEDAVLSAAEEAAKAGVRVYTVGFGTPRGAPVPEQDPQTGGIVGYKRDLDGQVVISKLNADLLRRVAQIAHGEYFQMSDPDATRRLVSTLQHLRRSPAAGDRRLEQKEQFEWFVGAALLLLALDALTADRRRARAVAAEARAPVAAGAPPEPVPVEVEA
ncbi:MAG: VWA domain-containing protein [Gemmatimonadetes bacterium]|nr:VWA domain-containing protein [Gemmatimonadota bacterium]